MLPLRDHQIRDKYLSVTVAAPKPSALDLVQELVQVRKLAESELANLRAEIRDSIATGLNQGRQSGFELGYRAGFEAGSLDGTASGMLGLLAIGKIRDFVLEYCSLTLRQTCESICQQILQAELSLNPKTISKMTSEMIQKLPKNSMYSIQLNPDDLEFFKGACESEQQQLFLEANLELDPLVEPGSIGIKTELGTVLWSPLRQLAQSLSDLFSTDQAIFRNMEEAIQKVGAELFLSTSPPSSPEQAA